MPGKDRHHGEGLQKVRVNSRLSDKPEVTRNGFRGAANLVGGSNGGTTLRSPNEPASAREAPIGHVSGLLIYLRHLGALNVDEFRRTNTRGL
jgi:hypothetical protein